MFSIILCLVGLFSVIRGCYLTNIVQAGLRRSLCTAVRECDEYLMLLIWSCVFQANPLIVASSGMFVNLSAVMLKLCEPFLDASLSKKDKIDARYVLQGGRLDFRYTVMDL